MARHHFVISGAGRSGTTFLVEFLRHCGMDTDSADMEWHEDARAGLERPLSSRADLPYVVKDPWLWTYVDDLLLGEEVVIDALVVPIRDLKSSAESRVLQEKSAIAASTGRPVAHLPAWGTVPGGVVYSLDVHDQENLLARSLFKLLETSVRHEVPVALLSFPGLVNDFERLWRPLESLLEGQVTLDVAKEAFAATRRPEWIRVGTVPTTREQRLADELSRRLQQEKQRAAGLEARLSGTAHRLTELEAALSQISDERDALAAKAHEERDALAAKAHEEWELRLDAERQLDRELRRRFRHRIRRAAGALVGR